MDDIESEQLIHLVQARPALYDKNLIAYGERHTKLKLWHEISAILIPSWNQLTPSERTQTVMKIQSRWQNLRTCFKKEYNIQRGIKAGKVVRKRRKKYEFFEQLRFLLPTVHDRLPTNDISHTDDVHESKSPTTTKYREPELATASKIECPSGIAPSTNTLHTNSQPTIWANNVEWQNIVTPSTNTTQSLNYPKPTFPRNKSKHSRKNRSYEERLLHILEKTTNEESDEDTLFLLSLVPSLKRMTNSQKLKVKMKFLQALSEIEDQAQPPLVSSPVSIWLNSAHDNIPGTNHLHGHADPGSPTSPQSKHSKLSDDSH